MWQIEAELLAGLPSWEEASGRPFLVQGLRVIDTIQEALEAKEMAKEAKKAVVSGWTTTTELMGIAWPSTKCSGRSGDTCFFDISETTGASAEYRTWAYTDGCKPSKEDANQHWHFICCLDNLARAEIS